MSNPESKSDTTPQTPQPHDKKLSLIYPYPDKLDHLISSDGRSSKYALVIVAAKRSRQIKEGARVLVEMEQRGGEKKYNPLTVAFMEMSQDKIIPLQVGEPEPLPSSLPATPVLGGLVATSLDDDLFRDPTGPVDLSSLIADEDLEGFESEEDMEDGLVGEVDVMERDLIAVPDDDHYGISGEDGEFEDEGFGDEEESLDLLMEEEEVEEE